jgi:GNAT superfamily N-acetyltransferase
MTFTSVATVQISYLADRPDLGTALVPALLEHWKPFFPEDTWVARQRRLEQHMNREVLPIGWVAHIGDEAVGTAALRATDLHGHEHLTPWLGGVFVRRPFRRRSIASSLCGVVEDKARALGFDRLYLFTIDQQALYARLGWSPIERVEFRGLGCELMVKPLRP